MDSIKHRINQIKFYIKKYGFFRTIIKCIKAVIRKVIRFLKGEKYLSYGDYDGWIRFNEVREESELKKQAQKRFSNSPKISVIVPMFKTKEKFFKDLVNCMINQTYSNWELCLADGSPVQNENYKKYYEKDKRIKYKFLGKNRGIAGNTNDGIEMATGEYIALLDHDDILADYALFEVVKCINKYPNVEFMYSDEDKIDGRNNRYDAYFKPDFAPDTLRCQNYIRHFSIFKKELMDKLNGFRTGYDGAQDYDIFLRMSEITPEENIKHIPKILYHWRVQRKFTAKPSNAKSYAFEAEKKAIDKHLKRIGLEGEISEGCLEGIYRVDYKVKGNPKVSIIIPNKDGKDILKVCVNSVVEKTTYSNYEIIVVENNSTTDEIYDYYKEIIKNEKIRVVNYNTGKEILTEEESNLEFTNNNRIEVRPGFNYSAIINFGVKNATGEYSIQLNNDTELITTNWLELMLGFCQREEVGAVGVKLYFPDETIQHAGVVVGLGGIAGNRFKSIPKDGHGYFARESMIENLSAVTGACLMAKTRIYEEVNWMSEDLAVAFNDVDFCLKIREKGYLIVYNPFVEFWHYESKSRGQEDSPEKIKRFQGEMSTFEKRWANFLEKGDPYYNLNLSLDTEVYHMKNIKVNYGD